MSVKSRFFQLALSEGALRLSRTDWRLRRAIAGKRALLRLYFSVDDPQSYLLLRMATMIPRAYDVDMAFCLLPHDASTPDHLTRMQRRWATQDATEFAAALGEAPLTPPPERWLRGFETALASHWRLHGDFERLAALCKTFYSGDEAAMNAAVSRLSAHDQSHAVIQLRKNKARLAEDGHYASGAICFDGEAYRGVERLRHLTNRLRVERLATGDAATRQRLTTKLDAIERPETTGALAKHWHGKSATFFFSFRSPYSRLAIDRVSDLARVGRLSLDLKPVMPMVTRGVPLPEEKRRYLVTDAARVARRHGMTFGNITDPLGDGVRYAMAGFFAAKAAGKELAFARAAMRAIWSEGRRLDGLKHIAPLLKPLGVSMPSVERLLDDPAIEVALAENAQALEQLGHWGVPVLAIDGHAVWGQDRLWQFATKKEPSS
ncbi:MAG: DsbA family protein [Pseudomonadota bacterium]